MNDPNPVHNLALYSQELPTLIQFKPTRHTKYSQKVSFSTPAHTLFLRHLFIHYPVIHAYVI